MRTSILKGAGRAPNIGTKVLRSALEMYDLFRVTKGGPVYMHTGWRTKPPSGGNAHVSLSVNGHFKSIDMPVNDVLFTDDAGKHVIGFQSVYVKGSLSEGDGAVVGFFDKNVIYEGTAEITLPSHL